MRKAATYASVSALTPKIRAKIESLATPRTRDVRIAKLTLADERMVLATCPDVSGRNRPRLFFREVNDPLLQHRFARSQDFAFGGLQTGVAANGEGAIAQLLGSLLAAELFFEIGVAGEGSA